MRWGSGTVVLVLVAHGAVAAPARTCRPAGGVLFEVDQRARRTAKLVMATTRLYANGAWQTRVIDPDGKLVRTEAGCLELSQLADVRAQLTGAAWKTHRADVTCAADQPRFTVYRWKGRALYVERTCNVVVLDEGSRHVLELLALYLQVPDDLDDAKADWKRYDDGISRKCLDNPLAPGCM